MLARYSPIQGMTISNKSGEVSQWEGYSPLQAHTGSQSPVCVMGPTGQQLATAEVQENWTLQSKSLTPIGKEDKNL